MFRDEAVLDVKAGDGGDGCVAFRREKFVPRGGPSGGDGGDGGHVIVRASREIGTLWEVARMHTVKAESGRPGEGSDRHGASGDDAVVLVPPGTEVLDDDGGGLIKDLRRDGDEVRVARGGKGGRGNKRFADSINQAPREAEDGTPGTSRRIRLRLKLIADVGLLGLPNAGKSTLLSRLSAARPRIASYPFTTLDPQLGMVNLGQGRRFVLADIPGLVEGAHAGRGLGDRFLRHVERTRVLLHVVDLFPDLTGSDGDPVSNHALIRRELAEYSPALAARPELVAANKTDLADEEEVQARLTELQGAVDAPVLPISAVTGAGLRDLVGRTATLLDETDADGVG